MKVDKTVWITTAICAVIGLIFLKVTGLFVFGILGFVLAAVAVGQQEKKLASMTPEERQAYEEKKAQAKAERAEKARVAKEQEEARQAQIIADRMKCPHCGSDKIQPIGVHKKGFSVGKAVGGAVLTGGVGALAGFAGKKTKKTDWICLNCGKSFTMK